MAHFVFHIGPHKTGTSYLQKELLRNAPALADCGVSYDPARDASGFAHHDLARDLVGSEADRAAALRNLERQRDFAGERRVLLSSENFSRVGAGAWESLVDYFDGDRFEFLFFLRARSESVYSMWQEEVKFGSATSLPEYLAHALLRPHANPQINPMHFLGRLPARVHSGVRGAIYDSVMNEKRDLFEFFTEELLGLRESDLRGSGALTNKGLSVGILELLRCLNFAHLERGGKASHQLRDRLLQRLGSDDSFASDARTLAERLTSLAEEIDTASLNRNFEYLDELLCERFPGAIVNASAPEGQGGPLAAWPDPCPKPFVDGRRVLRSPCWPAIEAMLETLQARS